MKDHALLVAIFVGVVVGGLVGWLVGPAAVAVAWIGDLFLNALKMLVLPLVFCSMVSSVAAVGGATGLRRVAAVTFLYYVMTTLIAVVIGLVVVNTMRPGAGLSIGAGAAAPVVNEGGLTAIAESIISPNLFAAAAEFQILPILVFGLVFGIALTVVGEEGHGAVRFFHGCNAALLRLVDWVMLTSPVGVAALIAARIGLAGGAESFAREAAAVGQYVLTVFAGLALHAFVVMPLILRFVAGRRPWTYASNLGEALATAFATASSSATLAVTMRLTTERNRVSEGTASFVLPLGATVNMDGTALYEAVAALFIAQAAGISLGLGAQVVVALTATLASIGAAGIPQAGLVTMVIVLNAVGLPLEGIALILSVDWFLDRFRTTVNVWGDSVGAAVVDARNPAKLHP